MQPIKVNAASTKTPQTLIANIAFEIVTMLSKPISTTGHYAGGPIGASVMTLLLAIILSAHVTLGYYGIDFGRHWDEQNLINSVRDSWQTGLLLPRWYNYPSLSYFVALTVSFFGNLFTRCEITSELTECLLTARRSILHLTDEQMILLVRKVFFLSISTSAAAIFLAARGCKLSYETSAYAAALILGSFQLFYHARWIAPDTLVVAACSATICAYIWALNRKSLFLEILTAVAAAIGLSAKYPAGLLLLFPVALLFLNRRSIESGVFILAAYVLTFIFLTPGMLVEPKRFLQDVAYEMAHYRSGHGLGTVNPGLPHFFMITDFLLFRGFSQYGVLSALIFFSSCIGAATLMWSKTVSKGAAVLVLVPVVYVSYFSLQKVMAVRNMLFVIPFFALTSAFLLDSLARRWRKFSWAIVFLTFTLCLSSSYTFFVRTMSLSEGENEWPSALGKLIDDPGYADLVFSVQAANYLQNRNFCRTDHAGAIVYVLGDIGTNEAIFGEAASFGAFANVRGLYSVIAGPNEIDLDYYPSWSGKKRLVVVRGAPADKLFKSLPDKFRGVVCN